MMMGSCVEGSFRGRAVLRFCALLALVLSMAHPLQGMKRPAPIRSQTRSQKERHVVAVPVPARHAVHRVSRKSDAEGKDSRKGSAKNKSSKQKTAHRAEPARSAKSTRKPAAKPKPRIRRRDEEADNDPIPLRRASAHATKPAANPKNLSEAAPETSAKKTLTSGDFLRAAGVKPEAVAEKIAPPVLQAETFEHGESHPEDDERLPMTRPGTDGTLPVKAEVTAMVSAAPSPATPAGTPTLPEKLKSLAVKAGRAVKAEAADAKNVLATNQASKPPLLPLDKADRDAVIEGAMTPTVLPVMYKRNGHLMVPPPMKGTHEILVHQNLMADNAGLGRIQDDEDLDRMRAQHLLVALAGSQSLEVNSALPVNRRYARPWTAKFAADTAKNFYANFHQPLRLNSAVRTIHYQLRLQRVNGNAAGIDGEDASPHLTGQAIDFGKRGMTVAEIAWMRAYLMPMMQAGKIDVEEEFQQACFHISVYRSYMPLVPAVKKAKPVPRVQVAQLREPNVQAEDE